MPDIIVHASMAREVLNRCGIQLNTDRFYLGCYGPDPFLMYHFTGGFRKRVYLLGSTMHETRTGDFLIELTKASADLSYVAGFLCHYALDSTMHPLVRRYVPKDKGYLHMAIEHRLEVMDGGKFVWPKYLDAETERMVGSVIEKVYGFPRPMKKFKAGYRDLKIFSLIAEDRHRILCRLFRRGTLGAISYHTKLADDFDLSQFEALKELATERAAGFIEGIQRYKNGDIGEDELRAIIGNKSYSGDDAEA